MQQILEAILYGIIQGITEFLPISSTAHIRIVPALLHWKDPGAAYTAVIQIGTLIATLVYFKKDIADLISGFFRAVRTRNFSSDPYARIALLIIIGTFPISVFGVTLKKYIENDFRGLYVIAAMLIVIGILLYAAEKAASKKKEFEQITFRDGLIIGFAQALALIPGTSRSGVTITAGLFCGLKRDTAARFSFLLSLPAVLLSGVYELFSKRHELLNENTIGLITATAVSGIVGYLAIAFLINYLKTRSNMIFIIYRIALAIAILILLRIGELTNL